MNDLRVSRTAVYTGSFDPITLGHLNVIERSSQLFDRITIGIGVNVDKTAMFTTEERVQLVRQVTAHLNNVEVRPFDGLAVVFLRECESRVIVSGIRAL